MDEAGTLTRGEPRSALRAGPPGWPPWRPLLAGELAGRARRAATELAAGLPPDGGPRQGQGTLSSGSAGLAVCHAVIARTDGNEQAAARAAACLDHAIATLAASPAPASLYAGFTGVAWAAGVVDALLGTGGDRNEAIDDALASLLGRPLPSSAPYDLISGLTGLGAYALTRGQRGAGWRPARPGCPRSCRRQLPGQPHQCRYRRGQRFPVRWRQPGDRRLRQFGAQIAPVRHPPLGLGGDRQPDGAAVRQRPFPPQQVLRGKPGDQRADRVGGYPEFPGGFGDADARLRGRQPTRPRGTDGQSPGENRR